MIDFIRVGRPDSGGGRAPSVSRSFSNGRRVPPIDWAQRTDGRTDGAAARSARSRTGAAERVGRIGGVLAIESWWWWSVRADREIQTETDRVA